MTHIHTTLRAYAVQLGTAVSSCVRELRVDEESHFLDRKNYIYEVPRVQIFLVY